MKEILKIVEEKTRHIVAKRMSAMQAGEATKDDLLGILLETNFKEMQEQGQKDGGMSIGDVVEECKLFNLAGQVTTGALLTWTLVLLSIHQDWQERAREEVLRVFERNETDYQGLNQLKVVTMILHETLRLYPPATSLIRKVYQDTTLGKLSLPAGTLLSLQLIMLHHDAEIWGEDDKELEPERFGDGVANATNGNVSYFPFSWGPRICLGQNFALTEARLAMAMILQRSS